MSRLFTKFTELTLIQQKANVFEPQHLQGANWFSLCSRSVGKRQNLSDKRTKLEKRVKMASSRGTKGSHMKSPKKEDDDDDLLEDLVVDSNPKRPKKPTTYSNLKPGGFVTKAEDHKGRLEKRRVKIEMAKEQDDDDDEDDNDEETKKEQLERETRELQSELRKTERAAGKARDKEEREKAKRFSKRIQSGVFLKQPQAVSLVQTKRKRKSLKTEQIMSADEQNEEDEIPEGFHLQEESPHCLNMQRAEDFQVYL